VILTVRDASRAQAVLTGAPGRLTVLDEKTVYLRLPSGFLESDTLLMILRNLLRAAWERETNPDQAAKPAAHQPTEKVNV
jgi:transcription-repair coupling factor (superfamily II helicase)